jgi:hypothetical protein
VKLADIVSNIATVAERDTEFARGYLPKKASQIAVLGRGNPVLLSLAKQKIAEATQIIDR